MKLRVLAQRLSNGDVDADDRPTDEDNDVTMNDVDDDDDQDGPTIFQGTVVNWDVNTVLRSHSLQCNFYRKFHATVRCNSEKQ